MASTAQAAGRDYGMIEKLPDRLQEALAMGPRPTQDNDHSPPAEDILRVHNLVVDMIRGLAGDYYDRKSGVSPEAVDKFIADSVSAYQFRARTAKSADSAKTLRI